MKHKIIISFLLWMLFQFIVISAYPINRSKPKLIVLIVIDQFRNDYIARFSDQFSGGFKMIQDKGAFYSNAHFNFACTITAPGHACIATGTTPDINGIVANDWYDRKLGRYVYSCEDTTAPLWKTMVLAEKENRPITENEKMEGRSPRNLMANTIGDALKLATNNKAKVYAVSHKDRSAILLGGHSSNGSYWIDRDSGAYISSSYYGANPPEWLTQFNQENPVSDYFGKEWNRLFPVDKYSISRMDNDPAENNPDGLGITFPHKLRGINNKIDNSFINAFLCTPFSNEHIIKLAKIIIQEENLGEDTITDFLGISLSANDIAGHSYGPNSQEMQDFTLWTDKYLGEFFHYLEKKVGLDNTLVFLTADHGICPLPEILQEMGIDSGRIPTSKLMHTANERLNEIFNLQDLINGYAGLSLYLDRNKLIQNNISIPDAQLTALRSLYSLPQVARAYTMHQLLSGEYRNDEISQRYARSCYPDRSGDIFVQLKPYWFLGNPGNKGTTHGSAYPYDTHVPVMAFGYNIPKGIYPRLIGTEDIAPTIANIIGVELSTNNQRELLFEIIP